MSIRPFSSVQLRAILKMSTAAQTVEQVIRPTGLVDPEIIVKPTEGQIDDLISEINLRTATQRTSPGHHADQKNGRGPLTAYLDEHWTSGCGYMHHDVDTVERMEIIRDLRLG